MSSRSLYTMLCYFLAMDWSKRDKPNRWVKLTKNMFIYLAQQWVRTTQHKFITTQMGCSSYFSLMLGCT